VDHRDEGRNRIAALPGEGSGSVGSFVIAIERVDDAFLPLERCTQFRITSSQLVRRVLVQMSVDPTQNVKLGQLCPK